MLSHSVADVDNSLVMLDIEILPKPGACPGIRPHFNEGTSCYLSWPYGLIPHLGLVWNLMILNDVLTVHSWNCTWWLLQTDLLVIPVRLLERVISS